ncbi:hypothetical protein HNQ91_003296 [Filimonas zeae]|uniref:Uncharacterized protein n=1 Tax=Filimonas zeae TaxID=1737353 RepID=A0A917IZ28_9BACT|nr:hypothetical protein [Filimonas zeae]MDR6340231.1 hypothetical protein [Filimonas zeae]GGH71767.1 hypothetical protein GCM10011379_31460 [Filimonas zeae]
MTRLLLLFFPIVFLAGFFIAILAEQRKGIAKMLIAVASVFIFLSMILALMPDIKTFIWLNNFVLLVAWVAAFATAIKYFRSRPQERWRAFGISCLLILAMTLFTVGNQHVQDQLSELFCSYVGCEDEKAELVATDFFFIDERLDSVSTLSKGEKYNLIIIDSFYKAHTSDLIKLVPGFSAMKDDSVKVLTLSLWQKGRKTETLDTCVTEADELLEEFDRFTGLNNPKYTSLEELRQELNYATHDEFNAADLGQYGLKYQFMIPQKSRLTGEYAMQLEFVFKSGKRIAKQRKIIIN